MYTCSRQGDNLDSGGPGALAHILSESRTNGLSRYVRSQRNDSRLDIAFVGLNFSRDHGKYLTSELEPTNCFLYRAWHPRHPIIETNKDGCVAISTVNSWKMFSCKKRLPFICEIFTSKPKKRLDLAKKCRVKEKIKKTMNPIFSIF